MRLLADRQALFRDRDAFLYALLGVISCGKRLERALARLAPSPVQLDYAGREVELTLGVVSLWHKAFRELNSWRDSESPRPPLEARELRISISELTR